MRRCVTNFTSEIAFEAELGMLRCRGVDVDQSFVWTIVSLAAASNDASVQ
jgi:hypothetical protein